MVTQFQWGIGGNCSAYSLVEARDARGVETASVDVGSGPVAATAESVLQGLGRIPSTPERMVQLSELISGEAKEGRTEAEDAEPAPARIAAYLRKQQQRASLFGARSATHPFIGAVPPADDPARVLYGALSGLVPLSPQVLRSNVFSYVASIQYTSSGTPVYYYGEAFKDEWKNCIGSIDMRSLVDSANNVRLSSALSRSSPADDRDHECRRCACAVADDRCAAAADATAGLADVQLQRSHLCALYDQSGTVPAHGNRAGADVVVVDASGNAGGAWCR
jgi:hypothetical protein